MQYFNTTILPLNVLPLSARGERLFIIICYYSCFILFYMLLYLFLSLFLFKSSLLEKKIVSVTNKQYLLKKFSCSYASNPRQMGLLIQNAIHDFQRLSHCLYMC